MFRLINQAVLAAVLAVSLASPAIAGFYEGLVAAQAGDWGKAMAEWLPLAKDGNPGAQSNLGDMYARGLGVEEDQTEAYRWHSLAAEQGIAKSVLFVGLALSAGTTVEKDILAGATKVLIAQRLGHPAARQAYAFIRVNMSPEQEAEAQAAAEAWQVPTTN